MFNVFPLLFNECGVGSVKNVIDIDTFKKALNQNARMCTLEKKKKKGFSFFLHSILILLNVNDPMI